MRTGKFADRPIWKILCFCHPARGAIPPTICQCPPPSKKTAWPVIPSPARDFVVNNAVENGVAVGQSLGRRDARKKFFRRIAQCVRHSERIENQSAFQFHQWFFSQRARDLTEQNHPQIAVGKPRANFGFKRCFENRLEQFGIRFYRAKKRLPLGQSGAVREQMFDRNLFALRLLLLAFAASMNSGIYLPSRSVM